MTLTGYATPGKAKARMVLDSFCDKVLTEAPRELQYGTAAFYGVTDATKHLWYQARAEGREWLFADNAYFDQTRGVRYRVTRNRLQHDGEGQSDGRRFAELGIELQPWRSGSTVLIVPQSAEFMRVVAGYEGDWTADAVEALRDIPVRVRPWKRDKLSRRLEDDLHDCMAVVTHSSAAAINAVIAGVPAFCTGESQKALSEPLGTVKGPVIDRRLLCSVLADNEWTLSELKERPWV